MKKEKLKNNRKKHIYGFILSMIILILSYSGILSIIKTIKYREFTRVTDDYTWVYQIDRIKERENQLVIEGWAFELDKNTDESDFEIILYDIETKKGLFPEMMFNERQDVNEYFLCEYSYLNSGFTATISNRKIDLDKGKYEILLRPEKSKEAFSTGIYLVNGMIQFVNPDEFVPLNVDGTDLEQIIEDGILRVYKPDIGMYVYQFEGDLYWIAESKYVFSDGDTNMTLRMDTTQKERVPEEILNKENLWVDISFTFSSEELTEYNCGSYRVAKRKIPTAYSIVKMWTGSYMKENTWISSFRPWYEFK